jgi:hypothetical protein
MRDLVARRDHLLARLITGGMMKRLWAYLCAISLWIAGVASAQLPQIEDYSGDLWSRPAMYAH